MQSDNQFNNQFNNNDAGILNNNQFSNNQAGLLNNNMDTSNVIHTHEYEHGFAREQATPMIGNNSSYNTNPNLLANKPIGGSFSNNMERDRVASSLGSISSGSQGFYIGQDFYNPQLGLKGLKISPQRRSLLDDINGKKWKKLRGIKKDDLRDRSAPNFFIREHPLPQPSMQMKNLLADINGKKWKKLSAVPKDRYRDRSAPNLALWSIEKSAISPEYEKKYKGDKNAYQNDFYRPVPTTAEKAPVSNSSVATSSNFMGNQPAPSHLHSDLNARFPVSEGHQLRHQDNENASWQGNTMGEKVKSLGKNFTGWVKEEIMEVKDAVTHIGKRNTSDSANLAGPSNIDTVRGPMGTNNAAYPAYNAPGTNTGLATNNAGVASDLTAPGSAVNSGLKQPLNNNVADNTVRSTKDKTIY